jgi:hypothetical protein
VLANQRGVFGINSNTRTRDITDGLSSTFAIGEGAMSPYITSPKWTICRGRFCTIPAKLPPYAGATSFYTNYGVPSVLAGNTYAASGQILIQTDRQMSDVVEFGGPGYVGVRNTNIFGCTMEQLNKNPVTDTYVQFTKPGAPAVPGSWYTCASTWDAGMGPPVSLNLSGLSGSGITNPTPASALSRVPQNGGPTVGSISNFRSDHPTGALFLLCDGSVQFINQSIDMTVYGGLSTIQGGETVQGAVGEP